MYLIHANPYPHPVQLVRCQLVPKPNPKTAPHVDDRRHHPRPRRPIRCSASNPASIGITSHNLPFGIIACLALTLLSGRRVALFVLYLSLFQLHIVMDIFGSGPGWGIFYLWPFSNWMFDNTHLSWEFFSWQNITIAAALADTAIAILFSPNALEFLMPNSILDNCCNSSPAFLQEPLVPTVESAHCGSATVIHLIQMFENQATFPVQ